MGPYNISKYGVVALSETLSKEMQMMQTALGVSVLCPAFVATSISTKVVGQHVLDAVRNDRFWILTHDEAKAGVTTRADEIVNGINPSMRAGFA
jgi:short-subunit dehydrogenase